MERKSPISAITDFFYLGETITSSSSISTKIKINKEKLKNEIHSWRGVELYYAMLATFRYAKAERSNVEEWSIDYKAIEKRDTSFRSGHTRKRVNFFCSDMSLHLIR